jgi:hypothetical protein
MASVTFIGEARSAYRFHRVRSVGAVLAGASAIFLASALLEQAIRGLDVSDRYSVGVFICRSLAGAVGCSLTAWLAPRARAEHVLALPALAFTVGIAALLFVPTPAPSWHPLTVLVSVLPAALFGVQLAER